MEKIALKRANVNPETLDKLRLKRQPGLHGQAGLNFSLVNTPDLLQVGLTRQSWSTFFLFPDSLTVTAKKLSRVVGLLFLRDFADKPWLLGLGPVNKEGGLPLQAD